jgi:hypothetical protein
MLTKKTLPPAKFGGAYEENFAFGKVLRSDSMKRRFGYKHILLGLTLSIAVTGCANTKPNNPTNETQGGGTPVETPAAKQLKVKTFYTDDNLDKLFEREANITYTADSDKYKAALDALKTSPDAKLFPLSKGITYRSAKLDSGNLTIDLSIASDGRLGAPGEDLLVESIRNSMFQFTEVKTIEILVDGKKTESMMGHVSLPHPIKRN